MRAIWLLFLAAALAVPVPASLPAWASSFGAVSSGGRGGSGGSGGDLLLTPSRFNRTVNLAKSIAAGTGAKYCAVGDSIITGLGGNTGSLLPYANNITASDVLWGRLQQRIRQDEAANGIALTNANFLNFAIGGTTLSEISAGQSGGSSSLATSGIAYPSWWTTTTATWLSYLNTAGCTTVFINTGVNDPGYEAVATWTAVFTQLAAFTAIPDVVLITNAVANVAAGGTYALASSQAGYQANMALQRSLASTQNKLGSTTLGSIGLIDIGRYFDEAVLGFDPTIQNLSYNIPLTAPITGITTFPYTLPMTPGGDFWVSITLSGAPITSSSIVKLFYSDSLGGNGGSPAVQLLNMQTTNGTNTYATYYYGGPAAIQGNITTGWGTGPVTLTFAFQGDHVTAYIGGTITAGVLSNEVLVADLLLPRLITGFSPTISVTNPPVGLTMTINGYAVGVQRATPVVVQPSVCYGTNNGTQQANGINHDSSTCLNQVYFPVLQATQF